MTTPERLTAALLLLALAGCDVGQVGPPVRASNAWVRATVPGQAVGAAYLELQSRDGAVLVGVRSPVAAAVSLHAMSEAGGVMRMRELPRLELPAGESVRLRPGGLHLMLENLRRPLAGGETVPLVLTFVLPDRSWRTLTLNAPVR